MAPNMSTTQRQQVPHVDVTAEIVQSDMVEPLCPMSSYEVALGLWDFSCGVRMV